MEGSLTAASFNPPAADPADANRSGYPSRALLDSRAYFAERDNATTVRATTSAGHDVKVTFCLADPPAVSYFCVHFPGISAQECCTTEPRLVSSDADLALLCFAFRTGPPTTDDDDDDDCITSSTWSTMPPPAATSPSDPSLLLLQPTGNSWHAAIVAHEDGSFLVADLTSNGDLGHYNLHVFSSETNEWSTSKHLQLQAPTDVLPRDLDLPSQTDKVISLGESTVGWVDLSRGIVVCDVLEKEPLLRFLPLPKPKVHPESQAWPARDVTGYPNGFINFIEIESCVRWYKFIRMRSFKTTAYLDILDHIHDTEILEHHEMDFVENEIKCVYDGWKIRTCFRSISWDHWRKGHIVHVDDISADTQHAALLPHLWNSGAKECQLSMLKTTPGFPTFSIYGIDFVYLMSEVGRVDKTPWMFGVDIGKKSLEVIKPYCASRAPYSDQTFKNSFISCVFSAYLNTASN